MVIFPAEMKVLRDSYVSVNEAEKKHMERRYGRLMLKQLVEEGFSEEWLNQNSKKCPCCNTHIEVRG